MEKFKSVSAYVVLLFMVGVFIVLVSSYLTEISESKFADLSNSSKVYINEVTGTQKFGFNDSIYNESIGKASSLGGNDNKNEFSLDFSFGDKSGSKLQRFIYVVANMPTFIIVDILKLSFLDWFAKLLDWALGIFLFIAFVIYIRRGDN